MRTASRFSIATALVTALWLMASPFTGSTAQNPPPQVPQVSQSPASRPVSTPVPKSSPDGNVTPAADEDEIVRITTNLVQVDAVVTDKNGNQVTDLTADDFEILEDGHAQTITNFSFVSNEAPAGAPVAVASPAGTTTTSEVPAVPVTTQSHRTIAIVVDDLMMSMESAYYARRAVRQFIDTGLSPGDKIAIMRTSLAVDALQQFTSNKEQLYATSARLRGKENQTLQAKVQECQEGVGAIEAGLIANDTTDEYTGFRDQLRLTGTLRALDRIFRRMRELPGRKAVVLFSDGPFACPENPQKEIDFQDRLRRITDTANRSAVVVYSIDPRGIMVLDSAAEPGSITRNPAVSAQRFMRMSRAISVTQHAFDFLIDSTGGLAIRNTNATSGALRRAIDDQKGYYLLGYRPSDETFQKGSPRYNSLKVKVKRAGLNVRTRSGFFGYVEKNPKRRQRGTPLTGVDSSFEAGEIDVRLTSLFANEPAGSFMASMLHINPVALTFKDEPDGWHEAVMEVLAIIFDVDGQIVEQVHKSQTVRARGNTYERLMKNGFVYSLNVPVKKPGGYHLRIEVRDVATDKIGAASQFIDVPNLANNRLALSGIAVYVGPPPAGGPATPKSLEPAFRETERVYEPQPGPAYRRFRQNSILEYEYVIYNATATAGPPQLKTRITITRDGQEVLAGQEKTFDVTGQQDLARLKGEGRLLLGEALPPGKYTLKVTVVDVLAKKEYNTATQLIDFEIVR